jgi:hypothetical protein
MKKPNFDFERRERDKAKAAKKAEKQAEKAAARTAKAGTDAEANTPRPAESVD